MKFINIAQNSCLLILSCTISLMVLEGSSRVYQYGFDSLLPYVMKSIHPIGKSGLIQASDNLDILYELRPNLNTYFKKVRFSTNDQGLRDKNYTIQKSENAFRVAVIGDSFTMPAGVAIEDAYHSILEKRLSEEYPDKLIEFINFGVGGYGLTQYAAVIEHKAMAYKPDLILIGFCTGNDGYGEPARLRRPYQVKPMTHLFYKSAFMSLGKKGLSRVRARFFQSSPDRKRVGQLDQTFVEGVFGRIHKLTQATKIPVVVVALGIYPMDVKQSFILKSVVEKNKMMFLDVTQAFKGLSRAQFYIYRNDQHPNAKANRIFADQIYGFLKKLLTQRNTTILNGIG